LLLSATDLFEIDCFLEMPPPRLHPKLPHVLAPKIQHSFVLIMCAAAQRDIVDRVFSAMSPRNPMMKLKGFARFTALAVA
jgi:hypothetical protein